MNIQTPEDLIKQSEEWNNGGAFVSALQDTMVKIKYLFPTHPEIDMVLKMTIKEKEYFSEQLDKYSKHLNFPTINKSGVIAEKMMFNELQFHGIGLIKIECEKEQ